MPLHIDSIPYSLTKGALLRWLLDTDEVKKQKVGEIVLRGREAVVEVPEGEGQRLVRVLDGRKLNGRTVQVWFAGGEVDADVSGHFRRLTRWLDLEERAELEQAAEWRREGGEKDSSVGLVKLVIRGEDTGLGGSFLLTLGRRNAMELLPATRLGVGSPVQVTEVGSGEGRRGVVTRLEKREIEVALSKALESDEERPTFRVDAAEDETAMRRCRAALARATHARGDRLSELRDVLLGKREPEFEELTRLELIDGSLNESQGDAIASALAAKDVAIIHGPPGTGKTTTLVELIRQAIRSGSKVLACAPSNLGVDNLFERLIGAGESAVRIGHVARVSPRLREHTLSALVPQHKDVKRVKKLRLEANELFRKAGKYTRAKTTREERQALRDEAKLLLADAREVEADVVQEILDGADVVCATNTGLDPGLLGGRRFDLVVIDEACQCAEPSCWIPLLRAERMVLAGDHCQLPPTILSQEAAGEGFAVSLQERLVSLCGDRISKPLRVQHRMHREIMEFSSREFYEGRLEAHPSVASHLLLDLEGVSEHELTSASVRFIDTSGGGYEEERESSGSSVFNKEEAVLAVRKVRELMGCGVGAKDIAVITPYTAQVRLLRELLGDDEVEAGSIDGFQGREKEAVIISLVRSNPDKRIGFLGDTRRMNVALTRARRKLIVIGDSATISADLFYERLLGYFDTIGAYYGIWDEVE